MPLKYICPRCGKLHRNIDKRLLGEKVQCSCGKVIRLGGKVSSSSSDLQPGAATKPGKPIQTGQNPSNPITSATQTPRPRQEPELPIDLRTVEPKPIAVPSEANDSDAPIPIEDVQPAAMALPTAPQIPDSGLFEIIDDDSFEILDDDSFEILDDEPEVGGVEAVRPASTDHVTANPPSSKPAQATEPVLSAPTDVASVNAVSVNVSNDLQTNAAPTTQQPITAAIDSRFAHLGPPPQPSYPAELPVSDGNRSATVANPVTSMSSGGNVSLIMLLTCIASLIFGMWLIYHDFSWFSLTAPVRAIRPSMISVVFGLRIAAGFLFVGSTIFVLVDLFMSAQSNTRVFPAAPTVLAIASILVVLAQFFVFVTFLVLGFQTPNHVFFLNQSYSLIGNIVGSFLIVLLPMWVMICAIASRR